MFYLFVCKLKWTNILIYSFPLFVGLHFAGWLATGHRFDDTKGIRRRKISHHSAMASIVHIGQIDKAVKSQPPRKKTHFMDAEPHKVNFLYTWFPWLIINVKRFGC